jgi:hypothetical protein
MGASTTRTSKFVFSVFLAGVVGSCATVDQFGYRASAGSSSVQESINKEVLLNIIHASQYRSFSWNPVNQFTSGTTLGVTAGPSFTLGPVNSGPSYSPSASLTGNLTRRIYELSTSYDKFLMNSLDLSMTSLKTIKTLGILQPLTRSSVTILLIYLLQEKVYSQVLNVVSQSSGHSCRLL